MKTRRSFLVGATQFAVGASLGLSCSRQDTPIAGATTTEHAAAATTTTTELHNAWADADFAALDDFLATTNGGSFALMERGQMVHEWSRTDQVFIRDIASAQKSVLSLLVGRAVTDGLFATETPIDDVLGRSWTAHGETADITVRHLLTMTSGLDDDLAVVAEPGEAWIYSGAFARLFDALEVATGRDLADLADDWLFDAVGAGTAEFYERRTARYAPVGLRASAADLVAIGRAVSDGSVPGLPAAWLQESLTPSQDLNAGYGFLWWLNGQSSFVLPGPVRRVRPGPLIPSAPDDLVAALGKDDQKLYVSRELDLVVARLGDKAVPASLAALSSFDEDLWAILTRLRS